MHLSLFLPVSTTKIAANYKYNKHKKALKVGEKKVVWLVNLRPKEVNASDFLGFLKS